MSQPDARPSGPVLAKRVRLLLSQADLTEAAAATVLELDEASIRAYIAAKEPVPRYVILALERLVDMRMDGR